MLLQTNSYIVPKEKRTEHARLISRFRTVMHRLGCDKFEICEQTGPNWVSETGGRFVQLMMFRDEAHQKAVRDAEQADASAQDLVREFCELIDYGYQQQQGIATTAFYRSIFSSPAARLAGPAASSAPSATAPLIANEEAADEEIAPLDLDPKAVRQRAARSNGLES